MDTVSYGEFSQTFHRRTMQRHLPLSGAIEVTRRCPLTCVHCYNNLPMADHEASRSELTLEEHCRILDELADAGCLWLLFTGGEIFARRDFLDIYTHAKKRGFLITLFTNGTLIAACARPTASWRTATPNRRSIFSAASRTCAAAGAAEGSAAAPVEAAAGAWSDGGRRLRQRRMRVVLGGAMTSA